MAKKVSLASVANVEGYVLNNGALQHILSGHTLTESNIGFTSTMEEIRGGQGAKMLGRFNHDTSMTATITDVAFDLNYFKLNLGAEDIEANYSFVNEETSKLGSVIIASTGFAVSKEPKPMGASKGLDKVCVWFADLDNSGEEICLNVGSDITYSNGKLIVNADKAGLFTSTHKYCVSYFGVCNGEAIKVAAKYVPAEMVLIMTADLFNLGSSDDGSSVAGSVTIKIPRYQLDGAIDLSMAMSSAATITLNGTALAVEEGTCNNDSIYCEIVVDYAQFNASDYKMIKIDDASSKVGQNLVVYGLKKNGSISTIDNALLEIYIDGAKVSEGFAPFAAGSASKKLEVKLGGLQDEAFIDPAV